MSRLENENHILNLSGLKFWWIILIVFCHFFAVLKYCSPDFATLPVFLTNGHFSACGFLVLSGFLLYLRHGMDYAQGNPVSKGIVLFLKGFLRFLLLNVATMLPYVIVDIQDGKFRLKYAIMVLMNVLYVQDWIPGKHYSLNGVAWFLSSLMFIYLVTPLLFKAYRGLRNNLGAKSVIPAIGIFAVALLGAESFFRFDFYRNPLYSLVMFALGMVLADGAMTGCTGKAGNAGKADKNRKGCEIGTADENGKEKKIGTADENGKENKVGTDNKTEKQKQFRKTLILCLVSVVLLVLGFVYTPAKMPYLWDAALSGVIILCLYLSGDFLLFSGKFFTELGNSSLAIMLIHYMICSLPFKWLIGNYRIPPVLTISLMVGCVILSCIAAYVYDLVRKKNLYLQGRKTA
jgi:cation transport ATPase